MRNYITACCLASPTQHNPLLAPVATTTPVQSPSSCRCDTIHAPVWDPLPLLQAPGSMSSSSAQTKYPADLLRRRGLSKIPRDQQDLLNRSESWAVQLKDDPRRLAPVPGPVLETVKRLYMARKQKTETESMRGSGNHSNGSQDEMTSDDDDISDRLSSPRSRPLDSARADQCRMGASKPPSGMQTQAMCSSPERLLSWSPSAKSSPEPAHARISPSVIHETPKVAREVSPPPKCARPAPPPQEVPALPLMSTNNEETDVELDPPRVQSQSRAPINKHTGGFLQPPSRLPSSMVTGSTPPCAQPQQPSINSTVPDVPSPAPALQQPAKQHSFRRHKPHNLMSPVRESRAATNRYSTRMPFTRTDIAQESSASSPSSMPATNPHVQEEPAPHCQQRPSGRELRDKELANFLIQWEAAGRPTSL